MQFAAQIHLIYLEEKGKKKRGRQRRELREREQLHLLLAAVKYGGKAHLVNYMEIRSTGRVVRTEGQSEKSNYDA